MNTANNQYWKGKDKEKIEYLSSLFRKQTRQCSACSSKVSTLATINAIFIGATILFINSQSMSTLAVFIKVLVIAMIGVFLLSLIIMIWHIDPNKMLKPNGSGKEIDDILINHRTIIGIKNYDTIEEYEEDISGLTHYRICHDIISQIYYLNRAILQMQCVIKISVILNIIGIKIFMLLFREVRF